MSHNCPYRGAFYYLDMSWVHQQHTFIQACTDSKTPSLLRKRTPRLSFWVCKNGNETNLKAKKKKKRTSELAKEKETGTFLKVTKCNKKNLPKKKTLQ